LERLPSRVVTATALNSGGVQIARGLQGARDRFFAMFGTDLDAVGGDEFRIGHANEAEHF